MKKLDIEFKNSSTGSYSPWHLDIAKKLNVPLMITSDIGQFIRIGNDVYKIRNKTYELYKYLTMLEDMNSCGDMTDEDVLKEIDNIVNNKNKDFTLKKCIPLEEFKNKLVGMKRKQV